MNCLMNSNSTMKLSVRELPVPEGDDFFHPSPCALPDGRWLLSFQRIRNSDCYGSPELTMTADAGGHWSAAVPIKPLGTTPLNDGVLLGVADVRPMLSADGGKVLFIGCNTTYVNNQASEYQSDVPEPDNYERGAYYTVYDLASGTFGPRRILRNPRLERQREWRVACAQSCVTSDGDWLLPAYFEHRANVEYIKGYFSPRFAVETVKVHLEGDALVPVAWSNQLTYETMRGFIEPSLIRRTGGYFLTIRAEDGRAYATRSADGLAWPQPQPWHFDDGMPLHTDSTQQHWLTAGGRLFLVYTRYCPESCRAMRYRSILFLAEVDETADKPTLLKETEMMLYPPRRQDGQDGLLGNFHVCNLPDGSALVGDAYLFSGVEGDNLVAPHSDLVLKQITCN